MDTSTLNIPVPDIPFINALNGCDIYMVGGAVRDHIMGYDCNDHDYVVVGATVGQMISAGLTQVGVGFPVFLTPSGTEIAMARTEKKTDVGYNGFEADTEGVTIEEDLYRRDLTINSIAIHIQTKEIIDPTNGVSDIENKVIRMTNPKAFSDDPLRVVRLARFASRFPKFTLDEETIKAARSVGAEEFYSLPVERITFETEKAWKQSKQMSVFFNVLNDCDVLKFLFPELALMQHIQEPEKYHGEKTTYNHMMLVLDKGKEVNCSVDEFWMLFTHDFGKTLTPDTENHKGHEVNGVPLVESFCNKMRLKSEQKTLCTLFCRLHMKINKFRIMRPYKIGKMLEDMGVVHGKGTALSIAVCAMVDHFGRISDDNSVPPFTLLELEAAINAFNSITGKEIISSCIASGKPIPKGKEFGEMLAQVRGKMIAKVVKPNEES